MEAGMLRKSGALIFALICAVGAWDAAYALAFGEPDGLDRAIGFCGTMGIGIRIVLDAMKYAFPKTLADV